MRRITTTNSEYILDDKAMLIRKNGGEWEPLYNKPEVYVGHVMVMLINPPPYRTRISTPVVSIEEVEDD